MDANSIEGEVVTIDPDDPEVTGIVAGSQRVGADVGIGDVVLVSNLPLKGRSIWISCGLCSLEIIREDPLGAHRRGVGPGRSISAPLEVNIVKASLDLGISTPEHINIGSITTKSNEGRIDPGLDSKRINEERNRFGSNLIEGRFPKLRIALSIGERRVRFKSIRTDVDKPTSIGCGHSVIPNEVSIYLAIRAKRDGPNPHLITQLIVEHDRGKFGVGVVDEGRFIELQGSGNGGGVDEGVGERNVRQDTDDFLNFIDMGIAVEDQSATDVSEASIIADGDGIDSWPTEDLGRSGGLGQGDVIVTGARHDAEIDFLAFFIGHLAQDALSGLGTTEIGQSHREGVVPRSPVSRIFIGQS